MRVCPSNAEGFTLLEALVALAILGAVVVVGLETVGLGSAARSHAKTYASIRTLARNEMAGLRTLSATGLRDLAGEADGRLEPPFTAFRWRRRVSEREEGSGLYRVEIEVRHGEAAIVLVSYVNRFGALRSERMRAGR